MMNGVVGLGLAYKKERENKAPANSVSLSAAATETPCEMLRRRMTRQMFA